ncbi:MAG TPA: hypothetical protein VFB60_17550 [Ktedonobacteraceae bacterium]|nr:hypothetical protein [Ktedonobacteraceae bacterium]
MAKSRSIPTDLLSDPDFMELESDTQVILLLLVLAADDEGRGRAHSGMLARHFNKPVECIEVALATLIELELLTCYAVGRHRYYYLRRWGAWQTLSKPTPSRFPPPPASVPSEAVMIAAPREAQHFPGETWAEDEGEGKGKEQEQNPEEKMKAEEDVPTSITRFPHRARAPHTQEDLCSLPSPAPATPEGNASYHPDQPQTSAAPLQQVAEILHLPVTDSLSRLVTEYATFGSLALQGEADAAHQWITDPNRNHHNTRMSVAFFRRWLKREQEMREQRHRDTELQVAPLRATGTTGAIGPVGKIPSELRLGKEFRLPSLMHLAAEDQQARGGRR